jgi:CheY-like chemotaxis protein
LLQGISVLVADDNKLNQRIVGFVLQKFGARVTMANNGREAVELLTANSYDVILMDLQMPEMDGIEATTHIRQVMGSAIPIIGLTANTMFGEGERCVAAGMDNCISKPFENEDLCRLILVTIQRKKINLN